MDSAFGGKIESALIRAPEMLHTEALQPLKVLKLRRNTVHNPKQLEFRNHLFLNTQVLTKSFIVAVNDACKC